MHARQVLGTDDSVCIAAATWGEAPGAATSSTQSAWLTQIFDQGVISASASSSMNLQVAWVHMYIVSS